MEKNNISEYSYLINIIKFEFLLQNYIVPLWGYEATIISQMYSVSNIS